MGVEDVALANGYSIFLCNTVYDLNRGMKYIHSLIDRSVDGIIFMSSNMNFAMVNEVHANSIQSVVMDWGGTDVKKIASTITIDFNTGFQEAVRHLVELGHERIAFASGPRRLWTIRIRKQAFLDAIAGCPTTPEAIFLPEEKISAEGGRVGIEGGYMAFKALSRLKSRPSAVIATNDQIALGIIWAARDAGFKLPEDLSIIGLDDIDLASRVTPTLTTIALPRYEIGKLAMNSLLNLISNPSQLNNNQIVTTSLIVRGSTTRAPGK
jgi:LacI family transcriptional regulator